MEDKQILHILSTFYKAWIISQIMAVYINSLVMISIEKSETNKKRALEI